MELRAGAETQLRLKILGYEYPQCQMEPYDSNWLRIRVHATQAGRSWVATHPSLLTYEAHALAIWLDAVALAPDRQAAIEFTEPNLRFDWEARAGVHELRVWIDLELRPKWAPAVAAGEDDFFLTFAPTADSLAGCATALREQLASFPQRAAL